MLCYFNYVDTNILLKYFFLISFVTCVIFFANVMSVALLTLLLSGGSIKHMVLNIYVLFIH